jgi:hypothetical protein
MKLIDIIEPNTILDEAATRAFKRFGREIRRYYRCVSGPKAGKLVSDPSECGKRKDPRRVRNGKKVARSRKGVRVRKSAIAKRTQVSKMVTKMNRRLNQDHIKPTSHKQSNSSKSTVKSS